MKKFISWVFAIGMVVSVVSCREAEELTTIPEAIEKNTITNFRKDSAELQRDSTISENVVVIDEKDPPAKDKFEW